MSNRDAPWMLSRVGITYVCSSRHPALEHCLAHFFMTETQDCNNVVLRRFIALLDDSDVQKEHHDAEVVEPSVRTPVMEAVRRMLLFSRATSLVVPSQNLGDVMHVNAKAMEDDSSPIARWLSKLTPEEAIPILPLLLCADQPPFTCVGVQSISKRRDPSGGSSSVSVTGQVAPFPEFTARFPSSPLTVHLAYQCKVLSEELDHIRSHLAAKEARAQESAQRKKKGRDAMAVSELKVLSPEEEELFIRVISTWWAVIPAMKRREVLPLLVSKSTDEPYQDRVAHLMRVNALREASLLVDITAGATAYNELHTSEVLVYVNSWIHEHVQQAIGYVGDRILAAMEYKTPWHNIPRAAFGEEMKRVHFGLAPHVIMLNGSACGVVPLTVQQARTEWETRVQRDPVVWRFKSRSTRLLEAVSKLAKKLHCSIHDISLHFSRSEAIATVFRSLRWLAGDRILVLYCHQFDSVFSMCSHIARFHGVEVHVVRPLSTDAAEIEQCVMDAVREVSPKLCVLPHITDCGALLCLQQLLELRNIQQVAFLIDGSDALGNVDVNAGQVGADFYVAKMDCYTFCHPGVTALVTRVARRAGMKSLTVSYYHGQGYPSEWVYTGLSDMTTWLTIMQGYQFQKYICYGFQDYCRQLAVNAQEYLCKLWGVDPLMKMPPQHGVVAVRIPKSDGCGTVDVTHITGMLDRANIHVGIIVVRTAERGKEAVPFLAVRITCQVYNSMEDIKKLGAAVARLISMGHH